MSNIVSVDFINKEEKFNPLDMWRRMLADELEEKGYTTTIPDMYFPAAPVDQSPDIYTLNEKIKQLRPDEKLVMFRNQHFEIYFHYTNEEQLMIKSRTLVTGLDAVMLLNRYADEEVIVNKHYGYLADIFKV